MVSPRGIGQNLRLRAASREPALRSARALVVRRSTVRRVVGSRKEGGRAMSNLYQRGKTYWGRTQRQGREYRRSLKTKNRAIAERRLREWLEELEAIAWGEKPRRSWEETAAKFIAEHFPTIKLSAQLRYTVSMKHLN